MKNTVKLLSTLMLVLVLGSGTNVLAQRGNGQGPGNGQGRQGFNKPGCALNLTDDQQKKIDALRVKHQKEMLTYRNQLGELHAKMQTLRTAEKTDMNAINSTIEKISGVKTKQMKAREAHRQDVRNLLTDEQKTQFDMRQGQRGYGKGHGMRGGRGKGRGGYGNCNGTGPGRRF